MIPIGPIWRKLRRFFIYRVLSLDDTPHRIALGVACGVSVTLTPTIGLQMVLIFLLASLVRANRFVGIPFAWLSNPLTLIPLYGPSYMVGNWILGGGYHWMDFVRAMRRAVRISGGWWETTHAWWEAAMSVFWPLWVGTLVVAPIVGVVTYVLIYWGVIAFRRRRTVILAARHARREARLKERARRRKRHVAPPTQ